jgi:hypothetical protein
MYYIKIEFKFEVSPPPTTGPVPRAAAPLGIRFSPLVASTATARRTPIIVFVV